MFSSDDTYAWVFEVCLTGSKNNGSFGIESTCVSSSFTVFRGMCHSLGHLAKLISESMLCVFVLQQLCPQ